MKRALPLAAVAAWLAPLVPASATGPTPSANAPIAVSPIASAPRAAGAPTAAAPAADVVEPVSISTSDNLALSGDFYVPRQKGRSPAVILVHDAGSDRSQLVPVAERLQKLGFAVLAIDLRGHGASASDRYDWAKLPEEQREHMWALSLRDLSAGTEYLRSRSDVHTSNLSLVGLRSGAALAVRYAADDQNARAVVLLDPQAECHGFNLVRDVERLEGLPTLILAPSAARTVAERLTRVGHEANGGNAFIEQAFVRGEGAELLSDKRLPREVGDWLKGHVMPGKGDR